MKTALVVEDSALQRGFLVAMLGELGFGRVLEAGHGEEALQVLDAASLALIDLVITDVDMPGMDGIELITLLAERGGIGRLVVASARDPRLLETVECMAAAQPSMPPLAVVTKPVSRDRLANVLEGMDRTAVGAPAGTAADLSEIERALDAQEFEPFVQPQVAMGTGLLHGVEALARWRHPERGLLGPQHFIETLEGSPLMARFTLQIVERALGHWRNWSRALPRLKLSINLSADNLADAAFIGRLMDLVQQHAMPRELLTWEVTESMLMGPRAMASLARLGLKGHGLAMDDFGIGYSSMQTLSRSPFTELKIDRSFVHAASERANRLAIVGGALELGRRLAITTVAEGVENEADWQLLRRLGCDVVQGYFVARPMPADALLPWLRAERSRLRALAAAVAE